MPLLRTDREKLQLLGKFKFVGQAAWMLNDIWPKEQDMHAEELWNFVAMFAEFEIENSEQGRDLDEMDMRQTMQEMRALPQCRRRVVQADQHESLPHLQQLVRLG